MKTQNSIVLLCVAVLSLNGCRSVSTEVSLSPTHYTVSGMILAVSQASEPLLGSVSQSKLEDIVRERNTKTTRLPTLHILPGETRKVETGSTRIYPIAFDAEGNPREYDSVRDGLDVEATLSLMPDQRPKLSIAIQGSRIVKWITRPAGHKTPICEVRQSSTTITANWGEWHNIATVMATGTNKGEVILVRIDKPEKEPSDS
jgi:hypothetical protein